LFLRWWKKHANTNLVGLELNSTAIKLLELKLDGTAYSIENFVVVPLPAGMIVKDQMTNIAGLASIVKETFATHQIQTKDVALSINRSSVIIKNITVDKRLNPSEMEARAWVEANRHFPDLIGDIYIDFTVTGVSATDDSQLDVILVACRKEQIKPYLDLLQQGALNPQVIDVNCYALDRSLSLILEKKESLDAIAMLNLNLTLSSMIVSLTGNMIYAHDQSYDGSRLFSQVQKFQESNQPSDYSTSEAYITLLKENLSSHLRHTMHFFYSSRTNINIAKIIISGDCAVIPGIAEFIKQEVNIDTEIANPFLNITINARVNQAELQKQAPTLALCCGLGLSL
jgi:type IV pilus assembly protein PilM